ncbi:oplophorus-luciferin 2-monooxygenase non-catalytic subunit-like [Scylla paramamosain]
MNGSIPLLLCLLLSTSRGEEEKDTLQTSRTSLTLKSQEMSCPEAADILPCVCKHEEALSLECSGVEDEAQLRQVFRAYFPTTAFYEFYMDGNKGVRVLEDGVFGSVSFQVLQVLNSALETVRDDALTPSLRTLTHINVADSPLAVFPFHRLQEFTLLGSMSLMNCDVHSLPPLSSASLKLLYLNANSISHLTPDVFSLLTAVQNIDLTENHLTDIEAGTFTSIPRLSSLSLSTNMLSSLPRLTFALAATQDAPGWLRLDHNNIDSVEVDAFKGVQAPSYIELSHNALTTLQEAVWRPVMARGVTVMLQGNALSCGCVIAWLVRDPTLLTKAQGARCADGRWLTDLDPADFDICG